MQEKLVLFGIFSKFIALFGSAIWDEELYKHPNVYDFDTQYISVGIFGQNFISRVKNRDFLGKKKKIIAKIEIFRFRLLGPEKGSRPPLKGSWSKKTWIFVRPDFFWDFSKFWGLQVQKSAKKCIFGGFLLGAKLATHFFYIVWWWEKNVILFIFSFLDQKNTPPPK